MTDGADRPWPGLTLEPQFSQILAISPLLSGAAICGNSDPYLVFAFLFAASPEKVRPGPCDKAWPRRALAHPGGPAWCDEAGKVSPRQADMGVTTCPPK